MSDIAIRVENLGKRYRIGKRERYRTLRDSITDTLAAPFRRLRNSGSTNGNGDPESIWALKNISFEVKRGEVIGVIGRNGAGKSTLLKVLSRITEPTEGRAEIHGRVGSLLEVGTGFHPELTGRENIYLNGAILGMKRAEINRKFDEMVEFAEVEKFLDTPVKHYSSGMYVRLAFAVAAHLEPEILVVDEVLAVGDAAFQKKCLGKMGDVARCGRTVILVTHSTPTIEALSTVALLLQSGELKAFGEPSNIISRYLASSACSQSGRASLVRHPRRTSNSQQIMQAVTLSTDHDTAESAIRTGDALQISVTFRYEVPTLPVLGVVIKTISGAAVFGMNNRVISSDREPLPLTAGSITARFDGIPLIPGRYLIDLYFGDQYQDTDVVHEAISFDVLPSDVFGSGRLTPPSAGPVLWPASFSICDTEKRILIEA